MYGYLHIAPSPTATALIGLSGVVDIPGLRPMTTEALRSLMPLSTINVLVVEDDAFTRTTLCDALRYHGAHVAGEAATASEAIAIAQTTEFDVALLDLDLGGGPGGIDVAQALRRQRPATGIVILTTYEDPRLARKSAATLPDDIIYIVKRELSDSATLPNALESAIGIAASGRAPQARSGHGPAPMLTETQIEVMRLVAEGHSNARIAQLRFVTEGAVEKQIHRTARLLGIEADLDQNVRVQLARAYFRVTGATVRPEA